MSRPETSPANAPRSEWIDTDTAVTPFSDELRSQAVEAARPSPADMMRDRDRRRQRHLGRIVGAGRGARHHLADFSAGKPARLGELLGVDRDLLGQGLGEKPHHEARGKRPRLGRQIAYAAAADPRLLAYLAAHGLLERFSRLDEAGEARKPRARAPAIATEQGPIAVDREHDHDGIGAREVRRAAIWAAPHPTGARHPGGRSALGAEAVAAMPVEQRPRLGE